MLKIKKVFSSSLFHLILIFLIASWSRLLRLDLIEFKADQALSFFQVSQFFTNPYLPQTGLISSLGTYNFPLFNFLIIFLSLFYRNPQFLTFLIGLVNIFMLLVFYLISRKFFEKELSLMAALILASSPWAVLYSRSIWAQNLIILFSVPALYYVKKIIDGNKKDFLPLLLILTLLIQLHGSGIFFALATFIILLIHKKIPNLKTAILGIGIGLIPALPYFLFEISSGCFDCKRFMTYLSYPKAIDFYVFIRPFEILSGRSFELSLGKDFNSFFTFPFSNLINSIFFIHYVVFLVSIFIIIKYQKPFRFLLIYLVIPVFYFITKTPSYPHYFLIIYPVLAILFSVPFVFIFRLKHNVFKIVSFLLFLLFIFANLTFQNNLNTFLKKREIINGDYGPIFSITENNINTELNKYLFISYYHELKNYSYVFATTGNFNYQLGYYFYEKRNFNLAENEFRKALKLNEKNTQARINLAMTLIVQGKKEEAKEEINFLKNFNSTAAAKLETYLNNERK